MPSRPWRTRPSIAARKAASVLPEPVGAAIRVWRPALIAGQASAWAGVGAAKLSANQAATAGWKSSASSAIDRGAMVGRLRAADGAVDRLLRQIRTWTNAARFFRVDLSRRSALRRPRTSPGKAAEPAIWRRTGVWLRGIRARRARRQPRDNRRDRFGMLENEIRNGGRVVERRVRQAGRRGAVTGDGRRYAGPADREAACRWPRERPRS